MKKHKKDSITEVVIEGKSRDLIGMCELYLKTKSDLDNANSCLSVYAKENEELKHRIFELESELRVKEDLFAIKDAISEESRPSAEWYEQRYQSDCITINQLNVTIDVLVDKLAMIRKQVGL